MLGEPCRFISFKNVTLLANIEAIGVSGTLTCGFRFYARYNV